MINPHIQNYPQIIVLHDQPLHLEISQRQLPTGIKNRKIQ